MRYSKTYLALRKKAVTLYCMIKGDITINNILTFSTKDGILTTQDIEGVIALWAVDSGEVITLTPQEGEITQ